MTGVHRGGAGTGSTLLSAEASELSSVTPVTDHVRGDCCDADCNDCDDCNDCGDASSNHVLGCWPRPMLTTDESRNDSFLRTNSTQDTETAEAEADAVGESRACTTTTASGADAGCAGGNRTQATPDASTGRAIRKSFKGDIGLTLFSPLLVLADPPDSLPDMPNRSHSDSDLNGGIGSSSSTYDEDHGRHSSYDEADEPVALAEEAADVLRSSPRLLTAAQMRRIRNDGLHSTAQIMRWHRPYSLSRDGDSFHTMMEKCGGYRHTVVVCRTTGGDVLGGYADTEWKLGGTNSFFGSGRAFLFATRPDLSDEERDWRDLRSGVGIGKRRRKRASARSGGCDGKSAVCTAGTPAGTLCKDGTCGASNCNCNCSEGADNTGRSSEHETEDQAGEGDDASIYVFPWTGNNTYSQVCNAQIEQLAMGGGGSFGFIVQEHFSKGSTGPCSTFNNPRLIRDPSGCFEIVDLEVYGLKSCLFEGTFASEGNLFQH